MLFNCSCLECRQYTILKYPHVQGLWRHIPQFTMLNIMLHFFIFCVLAIIEDCDNILAILKH